MYCSRQSSLTYSAVVVGFLFADCCIPVIKQLLQDLLELQEEIPEAAAELTTRLRPLLSRLPTRQEEEEQEVCG